MDRVRISLQGAAHVVALVAVAGIVFAGNAVAQRLPQEAPEVFAAALLSLREAGGRG